MGLIDGTGARPDATGVEAGPESRGEQAGSVDRPGAIAEGALAGVRGLLDDVLPDPDRGGDEGARVGAEVGTGVWDLPSPSGAGGAA